MKRTPLTRKTPLKRSAMSRNKGSSLRRAALRKVNPERMARRVKAYRARLQKADWQELRRKAYDRDGGLCWCPICVAGRKNGEAFAFEPIPIWFDTRGKIHGFDTHHVTYARWGKEELSDLLTMHPKHHQALEATTGKRQRYLRTGK